MSNHESRPLEGVHYEVVDSREAVLPAARCGFNDFGLGNPALFIIETRKYSEYKNGTVVRSWEEQVRTFQRCQNG